MSENPNRRQALKIVTMIGGVATTVLLPSRWTKPVVQSIVVPAHAQASPARTTPPPGTTLNGSDVRLKRDIVRVGRLDNGLPLYRFRYLWSDVIHVGVMAQEVLPVVPEAVVVGENGFMLVDYDRLGARMMTWDEWQQKSAARPMTS